MSDPRKDGEKGDGKPLEHDYNRGDRVPLHEYYSPLPIPERPKPKPPNPGDSTRERKR